MRNASRKGLRLPLASDQRAMTYAPSAHITDSTELISAAWVLESARSFDMYGISTLAELRSKNAKPNDMPSNRSRPFS